ncbi:MarR family winged helix-turn-helix transcriptional regulator [Roseibium aggregatum]|nr:winged helix DNA-binding protein [Roseibium aggregatum]
MHKVFDEAAFSSSVHISTTEPMIETTELKTRGDRTHSDTNAFSPGSHFELVRVIERMYRRYLDRLRVDLSRIGADDISPSHAMLLFTIGDDDLSVRDLMDRGHYLGSNASYSLKQLVQSGYVDRSASARDRRSARIRLTDKGKQLCKAITSADEVNQNQIVRSEQDRRALEETISMLRRLEVVWATDIQQHTTRPVTNGF